MPYGILRRASISSAFYFISIVLYKLYSPCTDGTASDAALSADTAPARAARRWRAHTAACEPPPRRPRRWSPPALQRLVPELQALRRLSVLGSWVSLIQHFLIPEDSILD